MTIRIVCVGTGFVGIQALRGVIDHPDLELVGLVVHSPDKAGRDAGELAGGAPIGVAAVTDLETALAAKPDAVAYFATTHGRMRAAIDEFCRILSSGANLVTTSVSALISPAQMRPDVLARLEAACQEGGATCFSTGIDPGFFSDYLPLVMTGCGRRIDAIRIYEMAVYDSYAQSDAIAFDVVGFGAPIETVTPLVDPNGLRASWGSLLTLLAQQLDVELDEITVSHEMLPAPETFAYQGRTIEQGSIAGMRFQVAGMVAGRDLITLDHVTRARVDLAPDWPRPLRGDAYRVIIEGDPRIDCEFEFSSAGGSVLDGGFAITGMRAINAIPVVVAAEPGVRSVFDLPVITGRGRLR